MASATLMLLSRYEHMTAIAARLYPIEYKVRAVRRVSQPASRSVPPSEMPPPSQLPPPDTEPRQVSIPAAASPGAIAVGAMRVVLPPMLTPDCEADPARDREADAEFAFEWATPIPTFWTVPGLRFGLCTWAKAGVTRSE